MRKFYSLFLLLMLVMACTTPVNKMTNKEIAEKIAKDKNFQFAKHKALEVMKAGFNAGDGYREVWIRDYNTFIELAAKIFKKEILKENLLVFFRLQGNDGNIIDGYKLAENSTGVVTDLPSSKLEPRYVVHKNTVETDQESSLVQAVYKYIQFTGDRTILDEKVGNKTISQRLEWSMNFLMNNRYDRRYGLIFGATTADWGDVQPEHGVGVNLDENTHYAIDIYDNAMFIIALDNLMEMIPATKKKWKVIREGIARNCKKYLWDKEQQKFIPHIYLNGSPFPADFDENQIYYFGGTAVAIEAGLLSKEEIQISLNEMIKRVKKAGAATIGLTLYPPYPEGYFFNKSMNPGYNYQNGGDWTWFGGRMIQQLIRYGFVQEAYKQAIPMVKRVKVNKGFYEWYSIDNKPSGSGTFKGEAGVLFTAIRMFEELGK
jgi:GH15 family glucan-1,4-alpha-glucosidase